MNLLTISTSKDSLINVPQSLIHDGEIDLTTKRVDSFDDVVAAIKSQPWHAVLCNCHTPGFSSVDDLMRLKKITEHVPIFIVSESNEEGQTVQIMEVGRDDIVINSHSDTLHLVLKGLIEHFYQVQHSSINFMIEKKAFAAKEQMLSLVYHDIKNPVSAIQLDAQMLEVLSQKDFYPEMLSDIQIQARRIVRTVNRIKKLIADLLERHSSKNLPKEHSFNIKKKFNDPVQLINEVLETFGPLINDKKIKLIKTISSNCSRAYFDKDRLSQVISNLLSNAIKFTPSGKTIYLNLDVGPSNEYLFSIEDTGPGIDQHFLPLIFDKFMTNGSGNGLGLFICKEIIEGHGGKISAQSQKDHGARFVFSIPPYEFGLSSSISEAERSLLQLDLDNLICVIDDDEDLRDVISWALKKENFNVITFSDPFKALEALATLRNSPKLILLDYNLDQMTGEDFLNIKQESTNSFFQTCPVLMISAATHDVLKNIDSRFYKDILVKPIDLKKLLQTVNLYTK
jgi:signal transduction histidine kinase